MKFIVLTIAETGKPVYLNIQHIAAIWPFEGSGAASSRLRLATEGGSMYAVTESAEEIMALIAA